MSEVGTFVLSQLPPPPARVLEIGCGEQGGLVAELRAAGYEAVGVDPHTPEGAHFRRRDFREVDERFDAAVAVRVLHHVDPLGEGIDTIARIAPLLVVDEFAPERIDAPTQEWYEGQHSLLRAAGADPPGPPDLDGWRDRHRGLHPSDVLLAELRRRFEEHHFEERPYLYRWLGGPSSFELEQTLVDARAIQPIGYRYAGVARTETARSSAASR
jgi:SAM-dependent methyltransferase